MGNKKWLLGMLAMALVFGLALAVVGCKDDDSGSGGGKPTKLADNATEAQAKATLDQIIAYSGTPEATKQTAQLMKDSWSYYTSDLSSTITAINLLIDSIP